MAAVWHAVRTRPDAEGRASIGIAGIGREAYLPIELLRKDFRRGREIGWQPLFHGYMFARCTVPDGVDPGSKSRHRRIRPLRKQVGRTGSQIGDKLGR
jgi:hypothetical protein